MSQCGKRIGDTVYVHRTALRCLTPKERELFQGAVETAGQVAWNIAKVNVRERRVSLLDYPRFEVDQNPALRKSTLVQLRETGASVRELDYTRHAKPPVLHRKNLFLGKEE